MKVIMSIFENWSEILVGIVLIIALFVLLKGWIKQALMDLESATTKERMSWLGNLLSNLVPIALVLVTDAEIAYGNGTGPLKRSTVIAQLYDYIPDDFKQFVTEAQLARIVELALEEAKKLWTYNESVALLIQQSIQQNE